MQAAAADTGWIAQSRFFAYTPSDFHFVNDKTAGLSRESIEQDLHVLRPYGTGLVLYATDTNTPQIVVTAEKLKFTSVILGVWSVTDNDEINRAVELARRYPELIRGIALGNEGLVFKRYSRAQLTAVFVRARSELPQIALTTSEPFASWLGQPALLDCSDQDFLLPNIHPVYERWFRPQATIQSVEFVMNVAGDLSALCHKPVLVKETGIPSGPEELGFSEEQQEKFWKALLERMQKRPDVSVALFEAFDAPWKVAEIKKQAGTYDGREGYWGWFDRDRKPKPVVDLLIIRK